MTLKVSYPLPSHSCCAGSTNILSGKGLPFSQLFSLDGVTEFFSAVKRENILLRKNYLHYELALFALISTDKEIDLVIV